MGMVEAGSLKCCACGEAILQGPRFRTGGPTALLCWVCARLRNSIDAEAVTIPPEFTA